VAVEKRIRLDIPYTVTVSRDLGLNSVKTLVCVPSNFTTVLQVQKYVPRAARTFRAQISDFSDFDDDVKMFR